MPCMEMLTGLMFSRLTVSKLRLSSLGWPSPMLTISSLTTRVRVTVDSISISGDMPSSPFTSISVSSRLVVMTRV